MLKKPDGTNLFFNGMTDEEVRNICRNLPTEILEIIESLSPGQMKMHTENAKREEERRKELLGE